MSNETFENYEIALLDKRISVQDLPVDIRYSIDFWVDYTNKHSYSILSQFKYEEDILPVISELIKLSGLIMFFLNDDFKENRELVLSACRYSGESLTHLKKYQDDEEVVMVALKSTGRCFSSVSKRLQNKKAIALIALKDSPFVYDILSKDLQNDVDCIIASLQKGRNNIQTIKQYANNVDVMLVAIETDYTAIKYLDVSLRKNEQILEKLKSNIKKISPEQCPNWLWKNEELLIERVRAYPETVKLLGKKIENNIELLKDLIRANSRVYHSFTEKAQENLDVALQYVCYSFSIMGVPEALLNDRTFIKGILKHNVYFLTQLSENWHYDKEILYEFEKELQSFDKTEKFNLIIGALEEYKKQDLREEALQKKLEVVNKESNYHNKRKL